MSSASPRYSRASALFKRFTGHSSVRYLVVGGASFVLDFGLVFLLHVPLAWPIWLASATAFLASFVFNYSLQRAFAFSSQTPHGGALVRYSLLVAANTLVTVVVVSLFDSTILGWGGGKVVSTALTTVSNYFAYRFWVFPTKTAK